VSNPSGAGWLTFNNLRMPTFPENVFQARVRLQEGKGEIGIHLDGPEGPAVAQLTVDSDPSGEWQTL
jgi:hypothetical protein